MNNITESKYFKDFVSTGFWSFALASATNALNYRQICKLSGGKLNFNWQRMFSAGFGANYSAYFFYLNMGVAVHSLTKCAIKQLGYDTDIPKIRQVVGFTTGGILGFLNTPFQVVGVNSIRHRSGLIQSVCMIHKYYGWRGFFRAVWLSSTRDCIGMNIVFETCPLFYRIIKEATNLNDLPCLFLSASLVSPLAVGLVQPINAMRIKLQIDPKADFSTTFRKTIQAEGYKGLFRGWKERMWTYMIMNLWQTFIQTNERKFLHVK